MSKIITVLLTCGVRPTTCFCKLASLALDLYTNVDLHTHVIASVALVLRECSFAYVYTNYKPKF